MKNLPFFLFSLFLLFLGANPSFAASTDILITEIMYDHPGSDTNHEWVEIYNSGLETVTLVGGSGSSAWRFYDGSNHLLSKTALQGSMALEAGEYAVIAQDGAVFLLDHPRYTRTIIVCSAMSLKNSSGTVGLRIGSGGTLWSEITYESSWGGAGNGKTIEKKEVLGANESSNWVESSVEGGSPGEAYSPPSYPSGIYLWEYLPHPNDNGEEWVELYNDNAEAVTLTNWQIDDLENGGSSPKSFTATIPGKGYITVDLGSSFLNNDGDSLRLIRPDGVLVEETNFTAAYQGNSFAKDAAGNWQETAAATPGEANIITSPVHNGTVADLKNLTLGSRVSLEAHATAPPDLLGDDDFYLQDSGGIRVHCTCSLLKDSFHLGDKVKVESTIEESYGEKYIKTSSVTVLQVNQPQVEAEAIQTGEVAELREGKLVKIGGEVESVSGSTFFVDDGTGRAKVYLKDSTGIVRPELERGYWAKVIGLVSQYGYLEGGSANYRLLPRFQGDLEVSAPVRGESETKENPEGTILGALVELPRTGSRDESARLGWTLLFLGLYLRIKYPPRLTGNP